MENGSISSLPTLTDIEFPPWAIPIHIVLSLFIGIILTIHLEEPARNWMKQWKQNTKKNSTNF